MTKKSTKIFLLIIAINITVFIIGFNYLSSTKDKTEIKVDALHGPTMVSLLTMLDDDDYKFNISSQADAVVANVASNNTDIALIPANLAPILYKKTDGKIKIIDINTLSVIKIISQKQQIENFKGMTLYTTGKGTVVEALVNVFLKANNLNKTDINIQFKSEASEVVSNLKQDSNSIGFVNEPQATICVQKFNALHIVSDISDYWEILYGKSNKQITAVTITTTEFLNANRQKVLLFMDKHKNSIKEIKNQNTNRWINVFKDKFSDISAYANHDTINNCNNAYIDNQEMKDNLKSLYEKFMELNPALIGGNIPDDDIYFMR